MGFIKITTLGLRDVDAVVLVLDLKEESAVVGVLGLSFGVFKEVSLFDCT